jgi:hypothetical protein
MQKDKNASKTEQGKGGGGSVRKIDVKLLVAIIVGVVIIGSLVAVILVLLNREPEVVEVQLPPGPTAGGYVRNPGARGIVVTEENAQEIRDWFSQPVEDSHFTVSMTARWTFPTALTPSRDAVVRNVELNNRTVFFDVLLEDRDEIILISPYIPVGLEFRNFALEVDLEPGEYTALVTYFLVDDDYEIITDVAVYVTIVILN